MTAEPTIDHRRIAIARDRLATWTRHRSKLDIEPGGLEALAGAIEEASTALEDLERARTRKAAGRRRLRSAMEDLRVAVEALGRGIARKAIAREENIAACDEELVCTGADPQLMARPSRGGRVVRPAISHARVLPDGRVRLDMRCAGLGRDPGVRVMIRRRIGRHGSYEPIAMARGATYIDRNPKRAGRYAAYKIEVVSGPMAGATSRRALADFLIGNPTRGHAVLHLEGVATRVGSVRSEAPLRAA
ncbi:MAG: hypothetical protein RIE32_13735 [Phycisphaerales bacterium]